MRSKLLPEVAQRQEGCDMNSESQVSLDVVAIAPHPDDLEILCGGTLAMLVKQGYKVGMFDLTSGEPTPRGTPELRRAEAELARQILGVQVRINLDLPNRVLMDNPENRFRLATELRRYKPDIIITMSGRTPAASPDHYQGQLIAEASRFYAQLTKWDERFDQQSPYRVKHLVYAPVPFDAEQRSYHATFVNNISDTIEQKLEAIAAYKSQFDEARLDRVLHTFRCQAGTIGARTGFRYGELFALPQPIGTNQFAELVRASADTNQPNATPAGMLEPVNAGVPLG